MDSEWGVSGRWQWQWWCVATVVVRSESRHDGRKRCSEVRHKYICWLRRKKGAEPRDQVQQRYQLRNVTCANLSLVCGLVWGMVCGVVCDLVWGMVCGVVCGMVWCVVWYVVWYGA